MSLFKQPGTNGHVGRTAMILRGTPSQMVGRPENRTKGCLPDGPSKDTRTILTAGGPTTPLPNPRRVLNELSGPDRRLQMAHDQPSRHPGEPSRSFRQKWLLGFHANKCSWKQSKPSAPPKASRKPMLGASIC